MEKVCITFNNCSEKFQNSLLFSNDNKEHFPQFSPAPVNKIVLYNKLDFTKSQVNIPVNFTSKETMIIDPLAYKLPRPRTSGAVFSGLGFLVCFGNTIQYSQSILARKIESAEESYQNTKEILSLKIQAHTMSAMESVQIVDRSDTKFYDEGSNSANFSSQDSVANLHESVSDSNHIFQESYIEKNDYKHIRTYADLLLMLKEESLTTSIQFNVISIFTTI